MAKNDNAHKKLSEQFKVHSIKRKYVALVWGVINEDTATIDAPIGRDNTDRKKIDNSFHICYNICVFLVGEGIWWFCIKRCKKEPKNT